MDIVITYCEECNFTPWATRLRDALQERYGITATLRDAGNGFFFVDVDGRRIFNNQETYGFPDHDQIFARLDALREQVR